VLALVILSAASLSAQRVVIDGQLQDVFWHYAAPLKLLPQEAGVPAQMGGEVRAVVAGHYLYLSASLPELAGKVVARSIGVNPIWEGGDEARQLQFPRMINAAANGEDFVQFILGISGGDDWMMQVGPLGAYSVKWRWTGETEWYDGDPEKCSGFRVAASVGKNGWTVEAAIPLVELGSPRQGSIRLSVERNRAERPDSPEEWWAWPGVQPSGGVIWLSGVDQSDPLFQPAVLGNHEPPIEVGYRKVLPPLGADWGDPGWLDVSSLTLRRNEPAARFPQFPTQVKLIQDGQTLAVLARCIEPDAVRHVWREYGRCPEMAKCAEPGSTVVEANSEDRDASIDGDDSFQVYLATSGSYYVQYVINPFGYVLDTSGYQGNPRLSRPHAEWNSPVRGAAWNSQDAWFARLDIPLASVSQALGAIQVPRNLRVLLLRKRPGRDGEPLEISALPVTETVTPLCPARYRPIELLNSERAQLPRPSLTENSDALTFLPRRVFSSEQRKQMNLSGTFDTYLHGRIRKMLEEEKDQWRQVNTLSDWEHFRDPRLQTLRSALGKFPERCPLETRVISEFKGAAYRRQNIVFQTQRGMWVTANLYLPTGSRTQIPGIILIHSMHGPKTQFELQDMGIIWARAGAAVLVMDQIGYGERLSTYPWERSGADSRYVTGEQLYLVGSSLMTWMVWDAMRGIDLLTERDDINKQAIILVGAVAGGGDPAAVAAALDPRVAAVVPFNFGEAAPATARFIPARNQWPPDLADTGLYDWDASSPWPN
jgi:dienelactone hydrolase